MTSRNTPLNLFIDTNILLGFYRFSKDDLTRLSKLDALMDNTGDIRLIVTSQQVDEFYRNRDKVISEAIKELRTSISIPQLFSGHKDYRKIKNQVAMVTAEVERVKNETLAQAKTNTLKADQIIERLFVNAVAVDGTVIAKARKRLAVGNPPGKNGSLGDAINWEVLLAEVGSDDELHIVTQDSDFASALDKSKLNSFLLREWSGSHTGNISLYDSLNSMFKINFKDVVLLDEYIKDDLIRQIGQSVSFNSSRELVEKLIGIGSFSEKQIRALFEAAITNNQVYNAHSYSPELIGDKLWLLIKPHWGSFNEYEQTIWAHLFPEVDNNTLPE